MKIVTGRERYRRRAIGLESKAAVVPELGEVAAAQPNRYGRTKVSFGSPS
jgi:hypothetical protein